MKKPSNYNEFSGVAENLNEIQEQIYQAAIKSGRRAEDISIMAVTKTVPAEKVNSAIGWGITLLGENRVQELLEKYPYYQKDDVDIHFIGHLQSNKVKYIVDKVSMVQSVDSVKLAEEINRHCEKIGKVMPVLVEVNIGGETSKSGVSPQDLELLLQKMKNLKHIQVRGLMSIPPFSSNPEDSRPYFQKMYQLFIDIRAKNIDNIDMCYLSMGMSSDYVQAIEEGANIVRIGSKIFGMRKY